MRCGILAFLHVNRPKLCNSPLSSTMQLCSAFISSAMKINT
jgi:hypothetical protein